MDHPVPLSPVTTDVVCPWCYLGKRRLEHAIAQIPEVPVAIRWRPFSLDPTVPPEGEDRSAYIVRKFGSLDAIDGAHQRLADFGRAEGIDYHFERITRSPNTLNAHRVVRWATTAGLGEPMVERSARPALLDAVSARRFPAPGSHRRNDPGAARPRLAGSAVDANAFARHTRTRRS